MDFFFLFLYFKLKPFDESLNFKRTIFATGLSVTMAMLHPQKGQEPSPGSGEATGTPGLAPSPQSEAVTNELQELSLQPAPNELPLQERKNGEAVLHARFLPIITLHPLLGI